MRNFKTYISLLFAGALTLTACQDDFDAPAMTDPDSTWLGDTENYEVKTINEIKTQYWEDADNYYKTIGEAEDGKRLLVKGRVISSDASGNIYKSLVIQDETGALAMSINANSMNNQYRRGQELVIDLTGMTIGKYAGLQQLGSPEDSPSYGQQTTFMPYELFVEHTQLNGIPNLAEVDTITVNSLTELSGGPEVLRKWQSQLVRFNNCYFADGGKETFAASKETVNRTLTLSDGGTIVVRTSGYSNFYADVLPEGHGDVVGLLSYHSSGGWQLLLLDRKGCMNFGNPTIGPGAEENPYTVDQAISIISGGGTASNVWTTGYIVGAVAPGVQAVSSNDDIQFSSEPDLDNTLVFAQEAECKDWTKCMVITLPQGSKLRQYGNLVDNPANYKKQIWLLGNFGTSLEMPAITGNNGAATSFRIDGVEVPGGDEPTPGQGDGTKESPYTVTQAIALNNPGSTAWVEGYIVGWVEGADISTGSHFSVPATNAANVLIAASPNETDYTKCMPIQLVYGTDARTKINLVDNAGNLGKLLKIEGQLTAYFKLPGIKAPTDFELSGEGGTTPGPDTPDTPVGGNSADFNTMNGGVAASSPYGALTSANGWQATSALLLQGGAADGNPVFTVFGDASNYAVCLNGKSSAHGSLTSPTLTGGLGTLSFDYCLPYSDNQCKLTINIKQNGAVVATDVLEKTGLSKLVKYEYSHAFNISGDFVIEIINEGPSNSSSNKDRTAIWNLTWTN